jgi:PAS domain S-box-containing protein
MGKPLKALIVEDSPDDAVLLVRELRKGGYDVEFERVESERSMKDALAAGGWDAVIADYALPSFSAPAALCLMQQSGVDLPFIVVSGTIGEETAVAAMRAGAHDYLMKDNLTRLVPAVERELREAAVRRDRRRAAAQLVERERYYRSLLHSLQEDLLVIDSDYRVTDVNNAMLITTGQTREEVIGRRCYEVTHGHNEPCDRNGVECPLREVLETGETRSCEHRHVGVGGETKWVEVLLSPLRDARGNVTHVIETVRDLSEVISARDALAESVRHWEETFDAIEDMVCIVDGDLKIIRASGAMRRAFGGRKVVGEHCCRLFHDSNGHVAQCPGRRAALSSQTSRVEVAAEGLGGRWLDICVYPIRDEEGRVEHLVHVARDVTERKHARQELMRERRFSNAVIETAGALIVVLDKSGRIVRFNKACEQTTGYSAEEVKGRGIWELLIPPDEREDVRRVFRELRQSASFSAYENHWMTRDGGQRLISWTNTRLLDDDGQVRWVIATGLDVTEQRQLEAQLARAAKLEAVGQLAGGIAHDFNNLLTAILGYVDLNVASLQEGTQLHEDLMQVRDAAKRASELTRQLLTFSRQQPGEQKLIDLNSTVEEICRMLRHLIEEDIEIKVITWDSALTVRADAAQIGQVLMNLAVNARDAMPKGGTLTIRTSPIEIDPEQGAAQSGLGAGAYAQLVVEDTGTGMDAEVRERIYDPFFTTKEVGQGTGLGLSTVYGIVEQHVGHIECISEPEAGTRFAIYLPLVEDGEPAEPTHSDLGLKFGGDETILLVEDEEEIRTLAARALRDFGYCVLTAADGAEALELLGRANGGVDLLLTDVVMPGMDGPSLAGRVQEACPGARLLFMTGYARRRTDQAGGAFAGRQTLSKPFTAPRLAERVREVLDAP